MHAIIYFTYLALRTESTLCGHELYFDRSLFPFLATKGYIQKWTVYETPGVDGKFLCHISLWRKYRFRHENITVSGLREDIKMHREKCIPVDLRCSRLKMVSTSCLLSFYLCSFMSFAFTVKSRKSRQIKAYLFLYIQPFYLLHVRDFFSTSMDFIKALFSLPQCCLLFPLCPWKILQ